MEQLRQQVIKVSKIPLAELLIRLSCFYKNEIVVRYIIKMATFESGYDNRNGLIITYCKAEKRYIVVSSNKEYDYITRVIEKV